MSRRILFLWTVVALMVVMVALSGAALGQGRADVCVSNKGENKVDKGASICSAPDSSSHAVATNNSTALAANDSSANAHNDSTALAGNNCTAKAHNGEHVGC